MKGSRGVALATALLASSVHAEFVSLGASRDATIYESADGSLANGAGQYLFAGRTNQGLLRRALVWFDVASVIPDGATITSARLVLNLSQANGGDRLMGVHRATGAWTTGASDPDLTEASGALAMPGDVTWLYASADGIGGGTAWQSAGGDFATLASATLLTTTIGPQAWASSGLLEDVRLFASSPVQNLGWFILGDESAPGTARRFDSADSAALGGVVPQLEIEFTTVPAPAAVTVFPLAGLGVLRRRRR